MSVIIKIDTGFAGAIHEIDTDLSVEEWQKLSDKIKRSWLVDTAWDYIESYPVDEETDNIIE